MKLFKHIITAALMLVWTTPANAASVTGHASAEVVEAVVVTSRTPLNFGYIIPSASGGTVVVTPQKQRTTTGGVQVTSAAFDRATFKIRGAANRSYNIHTPNSALFTVSDPAPGSEGLRRSLTVDQFVTYSVNQGAGGTTGSLGTNGEDTIYLGATLHVPSDAAPGVYSGLVEITVSY